MVPRWLGPLHWSAAINLVLRYEAKQKLMALQLHKRYRRFVISRTDQFYGCPLLLDKLAPSTRNPRQWLGRWLGSTSTVWIPQGEDSGAVCDRLMVFSRHSVLAGLSLIDNFVRNPKRYSVNQWRQASPEYFVAERLKELGLHVSRFPRTLFTAAATGDATRWSLMSDEEDGAFGTRFKYPDEYASAKVQCGKCSGPAEPYCCRLSDRAGLLRAADWLLGVPLQRLTRGGGCAYDPRWFGRAALAAATTLAVPCAIYTALGWRRQRGGALDRWPRLTNLLTRLLPFLPSAAATEVQVTEGACTPALGFAAASPPSGLFGRGVGSLGGGLKGAALFLWGAHVSEWGAIRCSEALRASALAAWPAWPSYQSAHPPPTTRARHERQPRSMVNAQLDAHVLFVGCARNIAEQARATSEHIDSLGRSYAEHRVLIWEDSSSDGTRDALRAWAARDRRVRLLFADPPPLAWRRKLQRPARIAFCRDVLLTEALRAMPAPLSPARAAAHPHDTSASTSLTPPPTYPQQLLIAIDLDCPPLLQPHVLAASAQRLATAATPHPRARTQPRWHVLSANSLPSYYDRWALRSRPLAIDYDCLLDTQQIARRGMCLSYDVRIAPGAPIVPVDSAFNGVAIYSVAALRRSGCNYGFDPQMRSCEHVPFHTCLRRRGLRLGIDPSLLVGCGAEHGHSELPKTIHVAVRGNGSISWRGVVGGAAGEPRALH